MADIFLSYAREDHAAAERIARLFESRGYDVWWDPQIAAGESYRAVIDRALTDARCVVVLWSSASVASTWVEQEANEGQERGVLVSARIEAVRPPLGFRGQQTADLASWDGSAAHPEFGRLLRGIDVHVPRRPEPADPSAANADAAVRPDDAGARAPATPRRAPLRPSAVDVASATPRDAVVPAGPPEAPSRDHSLAGVARTAGNGLSGLAIAAVVAVVLLSGILILVFFRREGTVPSQAGSAPVPAASAAAAAAPARDVAPGAAAAAGDTAPEAAPVRFRADAWQLPDDPLLGFIEVPAGPFTMGSGARDRWADADERPQHTVTLPTYFIGRYEVTVGQYKPCVAEGFCSALDTASLNGPDTVPVQNVSWYAALAYAVWLDGKLRGWRGTPQPLSDALAGRNGARWRITLPSEAAWERAARGTDGRLYPWGDEEGTDRANYVSARRGGPTPVGTFPAGASPVGALDMSGNALEWTGSVFAPYPYRVVGRPAGMPDSQHQMMVVRGGSWAEDRRGIRAASRESAHPVDRRGVGFRVAVVPPGL